MQCSKQNKMQRLIGIDWKADVATAAEAAEREEFYALAKNDRIYAVPRVEAVYGVVGERRSAAAEHVRLVEKCGSCSLAASQVTYADSRKSAGGYCTNE